MLKVPELIILASFAVFCAAQTDYTYSAYLDVDELFQMKWQVKTVQKDIEIQFVVKTTGWISLLITSEDGTYADAIVGGYNDETNEGYLSVNNGIRLESVFFSTNNDL